MELSKVDFQQWHDHPVTRMFLEEVLTVIDAELANLVNTAGLDPLIDRHRVGRIKGLTELAEWDPDTIEESENNVDSQRT